MFVDLYQEAAQGSDSLRQRQIDEPAHGRTAIGQLFPSSTKTPLPRLIASPLASLEGRSCKVIAFLCQFIKEFVRQSPKDIGLDTPRHPIERLLPGGRKGIWPPSFNESSDRISHAMYFVLIESSMLGDKTREAYLHHVGTFPEHFLKR